MTALVCDRSFPDPLGVVSAGGQVVRFICGIDLSLARSVSFCGAVNWYLAGEVKASNNTVIPNQFSFLVWESPSNFGLSIVIHS